MKVFNDLMGFGFVFLPMVLFTYKKAMNTLSHIHGKDSQGKRQESNKYAQQQK